LDGPLEISSKTDVVVVNHNADLEIDAGTIAMSFIADKTWGMQGLLSKDAKGYAGGGNHFVAYLRGDDLHVRFQSEDDSQEFVARNAIESGTEHDLVATFGDGEVGVYLDGALIGSAAFEMDWQENDQQMQVGGNGWASSSGSSSFSQQFDGTISNVAIYDSVVPSDQFELLL
ncbi:MAG: LamG-like jellyroll fold domain-containing protein, partial [Pseudomonadota bacterium]